MKEPVLVILAAGLGSRYGGLKQIDTVGNNGESIIDFSIYDAYQAGFRKVVLIIRREHEELFDLHIGNKIRPFMDVAYAYQDINDLPEPYKAPAERTKPWGTTHALLCTEPFIDGPFMVINADDFYGRESYQIMYDFLTKEVADDNYCMVGYQLGNTLSDNGSVTRGVCQLDENGYLTELVEMKKIKRVNGETVAETEEGDVKLGNGLASMNFWGFNPSVYPLMREKFNEFLKDNSQELKSESLIPIVIGDLIKEGRTRVKVLSTNAQWFGVTYPQDKDMVVRRIASYKVDGVYPFDLWAE